NLWKRQTCTIIMQNIMPRGRPLPESTMMERLEARCNLDLDGGSLIKKEVWKIRSIPYLNWEYYLCLWVCCRIVVVFYPFPVMIIFDVFFVISLATNLNKGYYQFRKSVSWARW